MEKQGEKTAFYKTQADKSWYSVRVFSSALTFGLGTVFSVEFLKNTNRKIKYAILLCHLILGFVLSYFDFINLPIVKETIMVLGICASMAFVSLL